MLFLAQHAASGDPATIGIWIGAATALMIMLNQAGSLIDRFREKPPVAATYATKEELRELRAEFRTLQHEIVGKLESLSEEMRKSGEARSAKLHSRIDKIIEEMPMRILNLLRQQP